MGRSKARSAPKMADPFERYNSLRRAVSEFLDRIAKLRRDMEEITLGVKKGSLPKLQRELMWSIGHVEILIKNRNKAWNDCSTSVNGPSK